MKTFKEFLLEAKTWNKTNILRHLKTIKSLSTPMSFYKFLNEYSSFEEFKDHLYWHGTPGGGSAAGGLKPSITFGKKWADGENGGGGYGIQYWCISVTKSKKIASTFSSNSTSVSVHPILISKKAKIINMDIDDAEELEEHIEDLWNKGIDAVYIGGGEQELCILNPLICVIGNGEYYKVFDIKVSDHTDEDLRKIWDTRKEKLELIHAERKQAADSKANQKAKYLEEYELAKKTFEGFLLKYENDEQGIYTLMDEYKKMSSSASIAGRSYELHIINQRLRDIVKAKNNWDHLKVEDVIGKY